MRVREILGLPLVALGLAVMVSPAQANPRWNVKCGGLPPHATASKLRPGIDCAHLMEHGETWRMPTGVKSIAYYVASGPCVGEEIPESPWWATPQGFKYRIGGTGLGSTCSYPTPFTMGWRLGNTVHAKTRM